MTMFGPITAAAASPSADERANTQFLQDPGLSELLSRLAALQGHAVPAYRFGLLECTSDGVKLCTLPRNQQAKEMWRSRFVGALIQDLTVSKVARGDFPLLWISTDGAHLRLIRGRLSSGALAAEDEAARAVEMPAAVAAQGNLLALRADEASSGASASHLGPQSASDWFAFAIRKQRQVFIEAVFATFLVSSIGLVSSIYSMQIYDRVVPTKGFSTLWVLTIGAFLAIVLEFTLRQVRAHMVERSSKAIDLELSAVFFAKALNIRMDARPSTVGTFASQIRHFESVRNFLTSATLFILADVPFALMFIGVMALIAGPVALVPLVMVPVALISALTSMSAIEKLTALNMTESNRKNGLLIEAVDGIESVKAAGGEWKMLDRYNDLTALIAANELKLKDLSSLSANMAQTLQQLNYVALIAAGAYAINTGDLSVGGLIACTIISGRALMPIGQIPGMVVQWKHAKVAIKSLDSIMAMPSDRIHGQRLVVPECCEGLLHLENAVFAYRADKPTLSVTDLKFKPGERVAVIGAVGSGKSTLVKMLSGLYKPKSGVVYLDGIDIQQLAPEFVCEHIGYMPQDVRLFNGSLRDNLTLGLPNPSDSVILRAARLTGLDQTIKSHPKGLELDITEGGRGLSGGQRQLVGLTRLLLAHPRIMLLDEPTASMDAQLEGKVMKHLFDEIKIDSVLVVITHKAGILPLVSRIIVVDEGLVVADGPRDEVLARMRQANGKPSAPPTAPPPFGVPA